MVELHLIGLAALLQARLFLAHIHPFVKAGFCILGCSLPGFWATLGWFPTPTSRLLARQSTSCADLSIHSQSLDSICDHVPCVPAAMQEQSACVDAGMLLGRVCGRLLGRDPRGVGGCG